jgi:hypothetical protein
MRTTCPRLLAAAILVIICPLTGACARSSCFALAAEFGSTDIARLKIQVINEDFEYAGTFELPVQQQRAQGAICVAPGQPYTVVVRALDRNGHLTHSGGVIAVPDSASRLEVRMHATANAPPFVVALMPFRQSPDAASAFKAL